MKNWTYFLEFERLIAVKSILSGHTFTKFEKVPDHCDYFLLLMEYKQE